MSLLNYIDTFRTAWPQSGSERTFKKGLIASPTGPNIDTMYLKSPFPDPPTLPEANAHNIFFKRPDQTEWQDFIVHIDVVTDERIMYREFTARIQDLATGLGAPLHQGGMGLRAESGEIVGIMAENSSVSFVKRCLSSLPVNCSLSRNISRLYTHSCS